MAPLTPQEQEAIKACEADVRTALEKYGCDIQGIAQVTTGNVQVNCVIVKVRPADEAPAAGEVGVPATGAANAAAPAA